MSAISHNQAIRLIHRRLDGLLNQRQILALDEHLLSCDSCRAYASQLEMLPQHLRHEFHTRWDQQPGLSHTVMEQVMAKARRIPMTNRLASGMKLCAGIAALIVMAFLINLVVSQLQASSKAARETKTVNNSPQSDGKLIAFASTQNGNSDIFTIHTDGSDLTNLTNDPAEDINPAWSPDGRRIAFVSNRDGNDNIYVINIDGSGLTRLTDDTEQDTTPIWSPDGTKIAYASGDFSKNNTNIYVMDSDGQNHHHLTNYVPNTTVVPSSWSPDSQFILFEVYRQIVQVGVKEGEITPLTTHTDVYVPTNFILSPDGSELTYLALCDQQEAGSNEFCEMVKTIDRYTTNGETHGILKIKDICSSNQSASNYYLTTKWSPDRTKILFGFFCDKNSGRFYLANEDGSNLKLLTRFSILDKESGLDWSPDSQSVIFAASLDNPKSEHLYTLNIQEALSNPNLRPTLLNASALKIESIAWQPTVNENIVKEIPTPQQTPTSSPNGLIAFSSDKDGNFDIYTIRTDGQELTNLTNNPARDTNPFWSPDGKHIAFESDRDSFAQIYFMDADGSNIIQLTTDKADHHLPLNMDGRANPWSSDGSKLLYLQQKSKDQTTWLLYSIDINSKAQILVASGRIQSSQLSWSPNREFVGYVLNDSATPNETFVPSINIVKADGTHNFAIKELLPSKESLNYPFYYWSQDGASIFFTAYKHIDEGQDRWIAYEASVPKDTLIEKATSSTQVQDWWNGTSFIIGNVPGSPLTWLRSDKTYSTLNPLENCEIADPTIELHYGIFPRRSSNGDQIIVVTCPNNNLLFYYTNSDGTIIKQLLRFPASAGKENNIMNIIWSPDGKFVAFKLTSPERNSMYILNVSEALSNPSVQPLQITLDEASLQYEPSWQPLP